jgi:hypothetical protein
MADKPQSQSELEAPSKSDVARAVAETVVDAVAGTAAVAAGPAAPLVGIASKFGKSIITYWVERNLDTVAGSIQKLNESQGGQLPPFAVIGLTLWIACYG